MFREILNFGEPMLAALHTAVLVETCAPSATRDLLLLQDALPTQDRPLFLQLLASAGFMSLSCWAGFPECG